MGQEEVVSFALLLMLVARITCADMPCSLYDVTTLRGSNLEVHSRTNAVGLKTNVSFYLGSEDPLELNELSCVFNGTETCTGWQLDGFELTDWIEHDPVDGWTKVAPRAVSDHEIRSSADVSHTKRFYEYDFADKHNYALQFSSSSGPFFISTSRGVNAVGLNFVLDPTNPWVVFYAKNEFIERYYSRRYHGSSYGRFEQTTSLNEPVNLLVDGQFPTVLLRKENNRICLWMKNANHSDKCLFTGSEAESTFSVIVNTSLKTTDFGVFERGGPAMQLLGTGGSVSSVPLDIGESRKLCISLRYYLKIGEPLKIQFIADDHSEEVIHSATLQGTGKVVSKQFSMILPKTNYMSKVKITFRTESAKSFVLRSSRKCSASDVDVVIIKNNGAYCEYGLPDNCFEMEDQTHYEGVGFSIQCSPWLNALAGSNEKCYHGGRIIDGWCQCLPGFTGTACENACSPGRFGADCSGACVDDSECKGTSLAAPGQPLECARGFTGPGCNETCDYGFYGPNCRLKCGKCLYGTCNRFTGLCTGPCRQGYRTRTCQEQLASVGRISVLSTSFDSAEVSVDVPLLSDEIKSYPFIKILYKKFDDPLSSWTSMVHPLTSTANNFTLDNLEFGKHYLVDAVLIHESGGFYQKESQKFATFATDCLVGKFGKVDVTAEETKLNVTWEIIDSEEYPCEKSGFTLKVYLPEKAEPLIGYADPQSRNAGVNAVLLRSGTFRLGVDYTTVNTQWTYQEFTASRKIDVSREFKILGKSTRSIDFSWSSSDGLAADVVDCKPEPILCPDQKLDNKKQIVRLGDFSLRGLTPFTAYKCTLETTQLEASTITEQDVPSSSPQAHDQPVQATNTTALIQWKNVDCLDINGIPKGFRIELWRGNTNEVSMTTSITTFKKSLDDLLPETSYEVKIYVVNQIGWNAAKFLSIPFKTKSTTPNAVTDLLVYKRTRHDLWLRWVPPESESRTTVVIAYKVTASAPGMKILTTETAPVQCSIWPEYVCHHLRSLTPDTEYTIKVQAKNNKVDSYGPVTVTNGMTKEGVPDLPLNVHIRNRTADSAVLSWEIPVMLNSNPKFFVLTLEQTDENSSLEKPTDSLEKKIYITEGNRTYEAKFDQLNPATTYLATISTGLRGQRTMISVHTPPKDPPAPPAPVVIDSSGTNLKLHGIQSNPDSLKTLSGYLLLVTANNTIDSNPGVTDDDVTAAIVSQFADNFFVAHEFSPSLIEEVFTFTSEPALNGNFSLIQNTPLNPGQKYGFALAAISTYCGAHAVTVSPVTFLLK